MKRYLTVLSLLTAVMLLLTFVVKWAGLAFFEQVPLWLLPVTVLYFAVVDGIQYWLIVNSMKRDPRRFIQVFLGITVGVLFLHLVVLIAGMLIHPAGGKQFAIGFLVLYVVYTVYVIASLVRFMRQAQQ